MYMDGSDKPTVDKATRAATLGFRRVVYYSAISEGA